MVSDISFDFCFFFEYHAIIISNLRVVENEEKIGRLKIYWKKQLCLLTIFLKVFESIINEKLLKNFGIISIIVPFKFWITHY